jgi:hypothetical protein
MNPADAVIDEIRESRLRMSSQCGHDPSRYVDYLKGFSQKYAEQVEQYRKAWEERLARPAPRQ